MGRSNSLGGGCLSHRYRTKAYGVFMCESHVFLGSGDSYDDTEPVKSKVHGGCTWQ